MQVPDGWLQVIRGPRPPAQKWPRARQPAPRAGQKAHQHVQRPQQVPHFLMDPDDIDPTLLDALEVDLASIALASSQVVLPSRDEFVATTDVAESDTSSEVGSSLPAEEPPRKEFPDMDISNATIRAAFASLDDVDLEGSWQERAS